MAAPNAASTAPISSWEKSLQQQGKSARPGKKGNPLMLLAVIAMIALASSGVWRAWHQAPAVKMVPVVCVKKDTAAGVRLGFFSLQMLSIPKELLTEDVITDLRVADNHVTKYFIPAGEPLRKSMFFDTERGMSQSLDTDERAITLKLDDDTMVDHQIGPEDLVDVLVVTNKDNEKYTKTIAQAARVVMSTSKEQTLAKQSGGHASKVTLAVSPKVAENLSQAADSGKIRLVLRNRLSVRHLPLPGSDSRDILPTAAFRHEESSEAPENKPLVPPAPLAPPLPMLQEQALVQPPQAPAQTDANPIDWIVQVFSGSKKETVNVPRE